MRPFLTLLAAKRIIAAIVVPNGGLIDKALNAGVIF